MDTRTGETMAANVYERESLPPGARVAGPAIVVEKDTTTVVSPSFEAEVHPLGHLILSRKTHEERA